MSVLDFFKNRWSLDAGKFYLAVAVALLFVSSNAYFHSFSAPPESTLSLVTGRLELEPMRRGSYLIVRPDIGEKATFTCDTGSQVYCPSLRNKSAEGKVVRAFYSPTRPELLLKLTAGSEDLLNYSRMTKIYRFGGLPLCFLVAGFESPRV